MKKLLLSSLTIVLIFMLSLPASVADEVSKDPSSGESTAKQVEVPVNSEPAKSLPDIIKYVCDDILVSYAAEFNASPTNVEAGSWIYELAGGKDNPVKVTYGKISFVINGSVIDNGEQFIKITGQNSSERFLSNSASYEYFEGTIKLKSTKILFWSGKQFDKNVIVKDYTKPLKAVVLYLNFDLDQKIISAELAFTENDARIINDAYYSNSLSENRYEGNLNSVIDSGSITEKPVEESSATPAPQVISDKVLYDFNQVDQVYSIDFTADPTSVPEANWVTDIAGSKDKPLKISYGKVNLKKDGEQVGSEQYIEVSGENGSERFLSNSVTGDNKEGSARTLRNLFWEGTKIVDNTVVKVYSDMHKKAVIMDVSFDANNNINSIKLSFAECEWSDVQNNFWRSLPLANQYTGNLKTLQLNGQIIDSSPSSTRDTTSPIVDAPPVVVPETTPAP